MLTKRLIACFDIIGDRVTKAVNFQDNIDVGPAEDLALLMYEEQIDELIFYDITASAEKRKLNIDTVRRVAKCVFIPFAVGGGIRNLSDMQEALKAGAEENQHRLHGGEKSEIITQGAVPSDLNVSSFPHRLKGHRSQLKFKRI